MWFVPSMTSNTAAYRCAVNVPDVTETAPVPGVGVIDVSGRRWNTAWLIAFVSSISREKLYSWSVMIVRWVAPDPYALIFFDDSENLIVRPFSVMRPAFFHDADTVVNAVVESVGAGVADTANHDSPAPSAPAPLRPARTV